MGPVPCALPDASAAIACNTFYQVGKSIDRLRLGCFEQTLAGFAQAGGFPVIVADSSPPAGRAKVRRACEQYGAIYLDASANTGIGPQSLMAIDYAYQGGAQHVVRIDPEKYGLTELSVLVALNDALMGRQANVWSIARAPGEAFESLPPYQQMTELVMGWQLASLGLPPDTASGIRAMDRRGMELFLQFDYNRFGRQWEFMWFSLLDAIKAGLTVTGLPLQFKHPWEMLELETGRREDSVEEARQMELFFNRKRVEQAVLIVPKVVAYAASIGIEPVFDPSLLDRAPYSFALPEKY